MEKAPQMKSKLVIDFQKGVQKGTPFFTVKAKERGSAKGTERSEEFSFMAAHAALVCGFN